MKLQTIFAILTFAALLVVGIASVGAQSIAPPVQWQKCFGGSGAEAATCIRQTNDSGYIIAGYNYSNDGDVTGNHGNSDYWIVRLSKTGTMQWEKSLGGSDDEVAESVEQTSDSGFIVAGWSNSADGNVTGHHGTTSRSDYWIVKLSGTGNIQWEKSLGGTNDEAAESIQQTIDGGYIVAGYSTSTDGDVTGKSNKKGDCWIVKLSPTGSIQWEKMFGGSDGEEATSIVQTTDGGYIIAGYGYSTDGDVTGHHGNAGSDDYWIVKLSSTGTMQWEKSLGGSGGDWPSSIQQTTDGGYVVAGSSFSEDGDVTGHHGGTSNSDCWVVKLDAAGNILWEKSLGGTNDEEANSIQETSDGGYIVAGYSYSHDGDVSGNHGNADYWIVKLSNAGSIQWQKSLGGSDYEAAWSVQQTADSGGFILAGYTKSVDGDVTKNHGLADCWIVKLGYVQPRRIASANTIDFGSLLCNASELESIEIRNTGGDTLILSDTSLNEISGNDFAITAPASFPIFIPPGDSIPFVIAFTPKISGNQSATFSIFSNDSAHSPRLIKFIGRKDTIGVVAGGRTRDTLDFGCVPMGTSKDSSILLTNISTIPATFTLQTINASVFTLPLNAATFMNAGDKQSVVVHFAGMNVPGAYFGLFITTDTCGHQDTVHLEAFVGGVSLLSIALQTDVAPTPVGAERKVSVIANPVQSVTSGLSFTVTNEATALQFDSVSTPCSIVPTIGVNTVSFAVGGCPLSMSDTIAVLFYQTLIGSTLAPSVSLQGVSTVNSCATVSGAGTVTINLLPAGCELGTVVVHPFGTTIQSIYPNPGTGITTITYSTAEDATVHLNIYDALGRTVLPIVNAEMKPGTYTTSFDVDAMMNGLYFLEMNVGSFSQTRELMLVK